MPKSRLSANHLEWLEEDGKVIGAKEFALSIIPQMTPETIMGKVMAFAMVFFLCVHSFWDRLYMGCFLISLSILFLL